MPRLPDSSSDGNFLPTVRDRISTAWDDFTDFIFSDNVLEVAVGLILAAAFTRLVNSFIADVVLPVVGLIPGFGGRNLEELFAVLKGGSKRGLRGGYNTVKQAKDDGALVLAYGTFVNSFLSFLILGLSLYTIAQTYQLVSGDRVVKRTVKCKYCRKRISDKAKRCFNCTSWQDGRED